VDIQVCGNGALSRLDDELAKIYAGALKLSAGRNQLMQEQREWLQTRNRKCTNPSGPNAYSEGVCLVHSYQNRIKELVKAHTELDGYTLLLSKDDELCNHMLKLFTEDLQKYPRGSNQHEEFDLVPWKPSRVSYERDGETRYLTVEGALFDFDNNGTPEFVVRNKGMLSSMRADSIDVLDAEVAIRANDLTTKELIASKNQIRIAGSSYPMSPPFDGHSEALWLLSPFIYRGVSYLYMQSPYEPEDYKGPMEDVMVISKYGGGRFVQREMTGKMEDVCYFKRFGVQR
jgi:hypothetical protein